MSIFQTANDGVKVISGPHESTFGPGETVSVYRRKMAMMYPVDDNSDARVNGRVLREDDVVPGGQTLQFIARLGEKG